MNLDSTCAVFYVKILTAMSTNLNTCAETGAVGADIKIPSGTDLQHGALTTIDIEGKRRYALIFNEAYNRENMEWFRDSLFDVIQNLYVSNEAMRSIDSASIYFALELYKFFSNIPS